RRDPSRGARRGPVPRPGDARRLGAHPHRGAHDPGPGRRPRRRGTAPPGRGRLTVAGRAVRPPPMYGRDAVSWRESSVRVFVRVAREGVSGPTDPEEMRAGGRGYERGCELMTADANAAVAGAFDAGADDVIVTDAHGSTKNIRADLIDERCSLIRG